MRQLAVLLSTCALFLASAWCDEGHHHALTEEEIGSVHFATSCASNVEASFNHAVALLHSFQYEQARAAFKSIAGQDPKCAMAQWGVAMSHYHGLWHNGDTVAGREAIHKAKEVAGVNPKTSPRELAYINALGEMYQEDGKDEYTHAQAFEQKMAALQVAYPDDVEAAIFHALLLGHAEAGLWVLVASTAITVVQRILVVWQQSNPGPDIGR